MMPREVPAIIVGAGLTGIAASYYLSRRGIEHLILEKGDGAGGIWRTLDWPGIRCDTEIINYSYSFKPFLSDKWLVGGDRISRYLEEVAREFGITERLVTGTTVMAAEFNSSDARWRIRTERGTFLARFLINANGYFSDTPYAPGFEGIETFEGELSHLFDLNRNVDLAGKRVVLVGSGASAITAAPALRARAASLTLLQRSPSYIYEQGNDVGPLARLAQKLYRRSLSLPLELLNFLIQLKYDLVFVAFRVWPWLGKAFFKLHWRRAVSRPRYQEILEPRYNPWEQRIPVGLGFRKLVEDEEIDVVTGVIARFTPTGILLEDGRFLDTDMCILATGFNLKFFRFDVSVDGHPVRTAGINFYKGMMMGGIPNYFQPFGPPHTSFTRRIEKVSGLVANIIAHMQQHGLNTVMVPRRHVRKMPRITPGYVTRSLPELPVIYGTLQLPSIDNWLFFGFRASSYQLSRRVTPECESLRREDTSSDSLSDIDIRDEGRSLSGSS